MIEIQGAQYELTNIFLSFEIYNVNYKGEVRTVYLCFREKSNSESVCLTLLSSLKQAAAHFEFRRLCINSCIKELSVQAILIVEFQA